MQKTDTKWSKITICSHNHIYQNLYTNRLMAVFIPSISNSVNIFNHNAKILFCIIKTILSEELLGKYYLLCTES